MSDVLKKQVAEDLVEDEGVRHKVYTDTVGKQTIGVGRNLTDKGLSESEIRHLLENDIGECIAVALGIFPAWHRLPSDAQRVCVNMIFQLGAAGFRGFKKFIRAVKDGRWHDAAHEGMDSRAARQTPKGFGLHAAKLKAWAASCSA